MRLVSTGFLGVFLALAGCGDDGASPGRDGGGGGGTDGGGGGTDGGGGGTDGGGGGGTDSGIDPSECYQVQFGPLTVGSGVERTQCVITRLGNPEAIHVNQIENYLGTSSHHMIVYRVNDTEERLEPFDCDPFRDTLDPTQGSPLVISQKEHDLLQLPDGVGFELEANQMVRLEMHYINTTGADVTLESTSTICPMRPEDFEHTADFLFIGTPDIDIPPHSTYSTGQMYFPIPSEYADANFFAITGHEHQYGTNVDIWTATGASDPGTSVYDPMPFLWEEPETVYHDPPFQVPAGGGFKFQCDWDNYSDNNVGFGESANQEMCFFWAYYYPGTGPRVCFVTEQLGGLSGCCPGSPVCGFF